MSTVTPSLRNAAAWRVAPPGPLNAIQLLPQSRMDENHQPGRYDAFGVDHALPWNIPVVEKVIGTVREGRKML